VSVSTCAKAHRPDHCFWDLNGEDVTILREADPGNVQP